MAFRYVYGGMSLLISNFKDMTTLGAEAMPFQPFVSQPPMPYTPYLTCHVPPFSCLHLHLGGFSSLHANGSIICTAVLRCAGSMS